MTSSATSAADSRRWRKSSKRSSPRPEPDLVRDWEFIDVGCGNGRSTEAIAEKLGVQGKGLGIDVSGARLPPSTAQVTFREGDVLELPNKKQCQFVTLINVLPVVPNFTTALTVLKKACILSRDFVYASQPNFDPNAYLLRLGLKTYYSDAAFHRFQVTSADLHRMARTLAEQDLIADFSISEAGPIVDSSDAIIHPLETPPDAGPYDERVHRYKPTEVVFHEPIYRRLQLVLTRKPDQLAPITKRLSKYEDQDNVVLSSALVG